MTQSEHGLAHLNELDSKMILKLEHDKSPLCFLASLIQPAACPGTGSAARYIPHGSACLQLGAALLLAPPPLCTDWRHHQLLYKEEEEELLY